MLRKLFLFHDYIDRDNLVHLDEYKYHGTDLSLLANHVFQPFWRAAVEYMPINMAPNLITLVGLSFMLFGYTTVYIYAPALQVGVSARRCARIS